MCLLFSFEYNGHPGFSVSSLVGAASSVSLMNNIRCPLQIGPGYRCQSYSPNWIGVDNFEKEHLSRDFLNFQGKVEIVQNFQNSDIEIEDCEIIPLRIHFISLINNV